MPACAPTYNVYKRVDVETASQGKLVVMLFNGAIQRAEEAKRQLAKRNVQRVHDNLIRAQDIVAELRGALNMGAGPVAQELDRIYEYFQHLLVRANIQKDPGLIDQCTDMMTAMRDTWQEVFGKLAKEGQKTAPPSANPQGNGRIDVQG